MKEREKGKVIKGVRQKKREKRNRRKERGWEKEGKENKMIERNSDSTVLEISCHIKIWKVKLVALL